MQRIQVLTDTVKSKIAAGEVIEGPFSVVKELIENALDAGATDVDIQVFDSGMKKIIVRDNGGGIHRDDITLAVMEHATSKITDIHDIEQVASYGFRGEALSSIASVSDLTILSRTRDDEEGARLTNAQGMVQVSDYAGPEGTVIIVENLFYNIPARKKFLKTKSTESRYIREVFLKTALANPGVRFSLVMDGKRRIDLPSAHDRGERVEQVYGKDVTMGLYHDRLQDLKVTVEGFVSKPDSLRSSRSMQVLYINGRPVEYRYYGYILSRAYEAAAGSGRYPAALLFVDIDPTLVDVNIHPAKREVKLFDQRYIDSLIHALVKKVLDRSHRIEPAALQGPELSRGDEPSSDREDAGLPLDFGHERGTDRSSVHAYATGTEGTRATIRDMGGLYSRVTDAADCSIIGVAFNTYLILQEDEELTFIDFHAAHERIIYDSIIAAGDRNETQELLFPKVMELPVDDHALVIENIDIFSEIGFDIEDFSDNAIIIRGVPVLARDIDIEQVIADFTDRERREWGDRDSVKKKIAASVACHSAKRAGDQLSADDMNSLARGIKQGGHELRCPHGRPFVYTLRKNDLERLFKRS